jgi:hypothetical protein
MLRWLSETLAGSIRPAFCASLQFRDAHGLQFDLHFSPFHDYAPFFRKRLAWESVQPLWAAATPISVGECKTLTLSATDQLLHTLDHGAGAHHLPPIRWVADATWLLRGSEPIEWDRFTAQAGALNLSWVASTTLKYLRDRHGATVPSSILKHLGRNVSALEMLEYSSRKNRLPRWIALRKCWALYARQHPDRPTPALLFGFVDFLKERWSAHNWPELVSIALKRFVFVSKMK